jgi:hypothetical protein
VCEIAFHLFCFSLQALFSIILLVRYIPRRKRPFHAQKKKSLHALNIKTGDFSLIVNEQNVREAINSFPVGSSPFLDGTRPQYLKDIISLSASEAGQRALRALTKLCNFLLSGQLPSEICHLLYRVGHRIRAREKSRLLIK